MKTIKDVYAVYKEWPYPNHDACVEYNGEIIFIQSFKFNTHLYACTREEYEQYKAEQEKAMETKCDWYDYDKGESVGSPLVGDEVFLFTSPVTYRKVIIKYIDAEVVFYCDSEENYEHSFNPINSVVIKPLDHDKYTKKVAPMDWSVKSGIDFEFSNDCEVWVVSDLSGINDSYDYRFNSKAGSNWKHCRPRMNHKHVLTYDQYNLMPSDVFEFNILHTDLSKDIIIVEFKGLKDGYKYEYDK